MLDFGYPQTTSTEQLKLCIHNEAVVVGDSGNSVLNNPTVANVANTVGGAIGTAVGGSIGDSIKNQLQLGKFNPRTVPSNAVHR
jgi:hypothetical protein